MKKDYQILLCENLYNSETKEFSNTPVCEIGSNLSKFEGKAYDIHLTHNINGTKELTFKLAKYYFDEQTGEKTRNFLPDMIVNKSIIEVKTKGKSYFFTVNKRDDEEEGDNITYSFSCGDAFIEELSKTGYGLVFSESNGLGTIHELAKKVVDGTDWAYNKEKSDIVHETRVELEYNPKLMRYDEVEYPVPTHDVEYIPELERYANKLDIIKTIQQPTYADYNGAIGTFKKITSASFIGDLQDHSNGQVVGTFSDGSQIIYYHTKEQRDWTTEGTLKVYEIYEIERIDYVTYEEDGITEKLRKNLQYREKPNVSFIINGDNVASGTTYENGRELSKKLPFYTEANSKYNISWTLPYATDQNGNSGQKTGTFKGKFKDRTNTDFGGYLLREARPWNETIVTAPTNHWGDEIVEGQSRTESLLRWKEYYRLLIRQKDNSTVIDCIHNEQVGVGTGSGYCTFLGNVPFTYNISGTFANSIINNSTITDENNNVTFEIGGETSKKIVLIKIAPMITHYIDFTKNGESMGETEILSRNHQLYCYEDSEVISSETVQNYIYNGSDFTDTVGWVNVDTNSFIETIAVDNTDTDAGYDKKYLMKLTRNSSDREPTTQIMNELAASANKTLEAGNSYAFKYRLSTFNKSTDTYNGPLRKIKIYDGNPLSDKTLSPAYEGEAKVIAGIIELGNGYSASVEKTDGDTTSIVDIYYVIKPKTTIVKPYIVFEFQFLSGVKEIIIDSFSLFPIKGKSTSGNGVYSNAEENNNILISNLYDGVPVNNFSYEKINDDGTTEIIPYLDLMVYPEDIPEAYTQKYILFFLRENYYLLEDGTSKQLEEAIEDTVKYLDWEEVVNGDDYQSNTIEYQNFPLTENRIIKTYKTLEEIKEAERNNLIDLDYLTLEYFFYATDENKYYQYYTTTMIDPLTKEERSGSKWDLALYGTPIGDRVRTYTCEKSNRFNQIQELGELFEAWPVFEMVRNEDGTISKSFYYKVSNIRDNYIGFHKGINLMKLSREVQSDEIVTKMYVEDVEANFSTEDGLINIRTATENPSGENFIYNFKYYVDQNLLNTEFVDDNGTVHLMVDYDRDVLYAKIRSTNYRILDKNEELSSLNYDLANIKGRLKSFSVLQSNLNDRIASLEAENNNPQVTETEKTKNKETISQLKLKKIDYDLEYQNTNKQYNAMLKQVKGLKLEIENLQAFKEEAIHTFENKYSQFIKEGVWSGNTYVDNNSYYYDALKVASTSSMPKVTWNIEVIDSSIQEDYQDFVYEVGDLTFLVDNEFFNVKRNSEENYTFKVLISQIEECLDKQSNNYITVQNYTTSFEDLFQRIAAASQTLELNEKIYSRAGNFTANGMIDASILQKSLTENSFILSNSTDNHFELDANGLYLQSIENPNKKLRAIADGIFLSNSTNELGEPIWKAGITADGINASLLNVGTINTSLINIMSNGQPHFVWNALGLTAHSLKNNGIDWVVNNNNFVRFDGFGLYFVDLMEEKDNPFGLLSNGKPWYTGKSNFGEALQSVKEKSSVNITRDGFLMNIKDNSGSVRLGYHKDTTTEHGLWIDSATSSVTLTSKGFNFNINNGADFLGAISIGYLTTDKSKYGIAVRGRPTRDENGLPITENYIFKAEVNNIKNLDEYLQNPGQASIFGFTINENALYTNWYQEWKINAQTFYKSKNLFYIHCPPKKNYGNLTTLSYNPITQFPDQVIMCLEKTYTSDSPTAAGRRDILFQLDTLNGLYSNTAYITHLYLKDLDRGYYTELYMSNGKLIVGGVIDRYNPDNLNPKPPIDYTTINIKI